MSETHKDRQGKRKDGPVETPKKLPAAFPKKFDTKQKAKSGSKERGKGARLHGSM